MKSLFVTGTDTGVGKTLVTALLALHFQARGQSCGVMKPFASGCELINGDLVSEDALFLRAATGVRDELDFINPVRLQAPLAPLVAARLTE
jgi:dethiobiotin synthetase